MVETVDLPPLPRPAGNVLQKPFWEAAEQGSLAFMRCNTCNHAFLPAREECPNCLLDTLSWEQASGSAELVSWVVYYRALNPAFAQRVPYTVAVVALAEGPRFISNIVDVADPETLKIGQQLILKVEQDGDLSVPRFVPLNNQTDISL